MALEHDFVLSDNSVNRYGFRTITDGIRLDNFLKNPIALLYHDGQKLSIGKWKNLKKEADGKFTGTCEYDEEDEIAVKVYKKYKNGYMYAVSIEFLEITETTDPSYLLPGQELPTILECELLAISFVNVPGNANAIKLLGKDGKEIKLEFISQKQIAKMEKNEKTVEQLLQENAALRKTMSKDMVALHLKRGAIETTEVEFFEKSAENDFEGTKKVLEFRHDKKDDTGAKDKLATDLVDLHFTRGAITEQEKNFFKKTAVMDFDSTKKVLEARKGKNDVDDFVGGMKVVKDEKSTDPDDRSKWGYLDFYKRDHAALNEMKTKEPEKFKKLFLTHQNALRKAGKVVLDEVDED